MGELVPFAGADGAAKQAALAEYAVWEPGAGRYAVGLHSVKAFMQRQTSDPIERTHGPDVPG